MSNVIKGYTVRYSYDEKKILSFNEKAEQIQRKFLEEHPKVKQEKRSGDEILEDGFIAGINALKIDTAGEEITEEQSELLNLQRESEEAYIAARREETESEMQMLLAKADEEASIIIKDAKAQAQKEKQEVFNKAKEDGYKDGIKKGEKEINALKAGIEKEKQEFYAERERLIKEIEPQTVSVIITLMNKLTGVLLEDRKDIIFYLVEQALSGVNGSSSFIIRVSEGDYELMISKKDELQKSLKDGTELEIVKDVLLRNAQCMIETESRIIDCSLDVQLHNITESLKLLAVGEDILN